MKKLDLENLRFGKLTAIQVARVKNKRVWLCRCDCGNDRYYSPSQLNSGQIKSCGCIRSPNLIGQTFNRLTILEKDMSPYRRSRFLCQCSCGRKIVLEASKVIRGHTKSCGCIRLGLPNLRLRKPDSAFNSLVGSY